MRSLLIWLAFPVTLLALVAGCNSNGTSTAPSSSVPAPAPPPEPEGPPWFEEVTASSGIKLIHRNGEEANNLAILESLGGGVGVIDFDQDGLPDLIIPGGGTFEGTKILGQPIKLFRNLGNFRFEDVSEQTGLGSVSFYCHAATVGDYDRDGWPDVALTGWGPVVLLHNESDGAGRRRFVNVSQQAGFQKPLWGTSAAWVDVDGDGWSDLYVSQYGDWSFEKNHPTDCNYGTPIRDICQPSRFKGMPHQLYRNNKNGTFTEVSQQLNFRTDGKGLGILALDLNNDQKPDLYATNDTDENFLYLNRSQQGQLKFQENGLAVGVARDDRGTPNGSMGVDAADYNGSGKASLFCTNYEGELHALYRNDGTAGKEFFRFSTRLAGLASIGQTWVGWGAAFADFDHHGWEDLFIANGHVIRYPQGKSPRKQPPVLFRNQAGQFQDVTRRGGPYFQQSHCSRGAVLVDLNNDGLQDLVISQVNDPVTLLKNVIDTKYHWLGLELVGKGNRDLVGSRVVVHSGGSQRTRFVKGGGSFASTSDRRLNFGLGDANSIDKIEVYWSWTDQPQQFTPVAVDGYYRLVEGEAKPQKLYESSEAAKPAK